MSRLTFRKATSAVAWQKQLRDNYLGEGVPNVPHLDVGQAVVRPVGRKLAEQIILKYEWLGTMSSTSYHYGIFFGDYCAGVTCVGGSSCTGGMNNHKFYAVKRDEFLILARGANVHWSPNGANSKLVAWTCKMLSRSNAGKVVVAYSDTDAGEIGTIYQACNWTYVGKSSKLKQWVSPIGRVYDWAYLNSLRTAQGKRFSRKTYHNLLLENGWTLQSANPKHRYVYVLDKKDKGLLRHIESMERPYPKRNHADA